MRYVSLTSKDRLVDRPGNIGAHWNRKYLRAIQCVLIPTHGSVSHRRDFFEAAFGRDVDEFRKILLMPEDYIINRHSHEEDGSTELWWQQLSDLNAMEREELLGIVLNCQLKQVDWSALIRSVGGVLEHYVR